MTYEELVYRVRKTFEDADARTIFVHIAVQINVEGEAAGIFYVEVADRKICVEPYDYVDRDLLFHTTAETLIKIADGELHFKQAIENGLIKYQGNKDKLEMLNKIKLKRKKSDIKNQK